VDGFTSAAFERDETRLVVKQIPARVCPSCGEAYMDEDVAVALLRELDELSATGIMETVIKFAGS
jgi:YgiT-type zinc finger domain-containing protein